MPRWDCASVIKATDEEEGKLSNEKKHLAERRESYKERKSPCPEETQKVAGL